MASGTNPDAALSLDGYRGVELLRATDRSWVYTAIREQDGIVYVPHPFDRMHAIPSPATLLRHLPGPLWRRLPSR